MNDDKYMNFLEMVKNEVGKFIRLADKGMFVRHHALKARKQSVAIRNLLKAFRPMSLENDRRLKREKKDGRKP